MVEITRTAWGLAAGLAATTIIGYCIYFDKKRRSDPNYKKKIRERRRNARQKGSTSSSAVPNLNDHEAIERYFLQEIQLGEALIGRGEFEEGVEHLANALVVCGQPTRLLQVLQSTLPAQVFAMLIMKMQEFADRMSTTEGPKIVAASASSANSADMHIASANAVIDSVE